MGSGRENMSGFPRQAVHPGLNHPEAEDKSCLLSAWLSGGAAVTAGGGGGGGGGSGAAPSQLVSRSPLDSTSARPLFPASARAGRRARGRGRGQCKRKGAARGGWGWERGAPTEGVAGGPGIPSLPRYLLAPSSSDVVPRRGGGGGE